MVFDCEKEPSFFFFVRPALLWRAATYYSLCRPTGSHSESLPSCACFSKVSYLKGADQVRARKRFTKKQPKTVNAGLLACLRAMATAWKSSLEGCGQGLRYARRCCPGYLAKHRLKLRAHQRPPALFKAIASNVALRFANHKVLLVHNHFGFVHQRALSCSQGQVVKTTRHPLPKPPRAAATRGPCAWCPAVGVANTPQVNPFAARDHIIHSALRALAQEQLWKVKLPSLSLKAVNSTVVFQRPRALKGVHSALAHIKHHWRGVSWFLAFEIKSYDTIDRPRQQAFLQERIDDPKFFVLMHQLCDAGASVHHLRRAVRPYTPPIAADVTPANPQQRPSTYASLFPNVDTWARTRVVRPVKKQPPLVCYKPTCSGPRKPNVLPGNDYGLRRRHQSSGLCPLTVLRTMLLNISLLSYVCFGPPKQLFHFTPIAFSLTWGVVKQLFKHHHRCTKDPADTRRWKPGQLWRLVVWAGLRDEETQRLRTLATCFRLDYVLVKHRWCAAASRHAVASKHRGLNNPALTSWQAALVSTGCTRHPSQRGEAKNKAAGANVAHRLAVYSRSDERAKALCLQKCWLAKTKAGFPKGGFPYPQYTTSSTALKQRCLLILGGRRRRNDPPRTLAAAEACPGCLRGVQVLCRPKGYGCRPVAPRPCLHVRGTAWWRHAQRLFLSKHKKAVRFKLVLAFRQPKALFKNPTVTPSNLGPQRVGLQTTWHLNQNKGTFNQALFDFGVEPTSDFGAPLSWDRAPVTKTALRLADGVFDLSVQVQQQRAHVVKHKLFKRAPFLHRTPQTVTAACHQTKAQPPNDPTTVRPYVRLKYTLGHIGLQQLDHEIDRLRTTFETKRPLTVTKTDHPSGVQRAALSLSDPWKVVFLFGQGAGLSERLFRIGRSQATGMAQSHGLGTPHFAHSAAVSAAASAAAEAAEASKCDLYKAASADEAFPSERPVRVRYVRYANELLLGIAGPASLVTNLRNRIIHCVQSDLKLPLGLAHSTHLKARQAALFLGFRLSGTQPSHLDQNRVLHPEREKRRRRRLRNLARLYKRAGYVAAKGGLRRTVPLQRPPLACLGAPKTSTHKAEASLSYKSSAKRRNSGGIRTRSYKCVPTTKEVTALVSTSHCCLVATSPWSAVRLAYAARVRGSSTTGCGLDLPSPTCSKPRWSSQNGPCAINRVLRWRSNDSMAKASFPASSNVFRAWWNVTKDGGRRAPTNSRLLKPFAAASLGSAVLTGFGPSFQEADGLCITRPAFWPKWNAYSQAWFVPAPKPRPSRAAAKRQPLQVSFVASNSEGCLLASLPPAVPEGAGALNQLPFWAGVYVRRRFASPPSTTHGVWPFPLRVAAQHTKHRFRIGLQTTPNQYNAFVSHFLAFNHLEPRSFGVAARRPYAPNHLKWLKRKHPNTPRKRALTTYGVEGCTDLTLRPLTFLARKIERHKRKWKASLGAKKTKLWHKMSNFFPEGKRSVTSVFITNRPWFFGSAAEQTAAVWPICFTYHKGTFSRHKEGLSGQAHCGLPPGSTYTAFHTAEQRPKLWCRTSLCSDHAFLGEYGLLCSAAWKALASAGPSEARGVGLRFIFRFWGCCLRLWAYVQTRSAFKAAATCLPLTEGLHTLTPQPGLTWQSLRYKGSTGRRHFRTNLRSLYSLGVKKALEVLRTHLLFGALPLSRRDDRTKDFVSQSFAPNRGLSKPRLGALESQSVHHQFPNRRRFLRSADDPVYSVLKHTVLSFHVLWCGINHLAQRQPCLLCPAALSFGPAWCFSAAHQTGSEAAASCRANSVTRGPSTRARAATSGVQKTAYGRRTPADSADDLSQVKPLVVDERVLWISTTVTSVPALVPSCLNEEHSRCAAKGIPHLPLGLGTTLTEHLWPKRWLFHLDKPPLRLGQGLRQVKGRRPPVQSTQAETIRPWLGRSVVDQKTLRVTAPLELILKLLRERGIITAKRARPSHVARLSNLPDQHIVQYYKGVALGLLNYYRGSDNLDKVQSIVDYQIYWSALFTLANKHKTSARQIRLQIRPPDPV
jgi:Type II intron maturase